MGLTLAAILQRVCSPRSLRRYRETKKFVDIRYLTWFSANRRLRDVDN